MYSAFQGTHKAKQVVVITGYSNAMNMEIGREAPLRRKKALHEFISAHNTMKYDAIQQKNKII